MPKIFSKRIQGASASPCFLNAFQIKTRAGGIEDVMEAYEKVKANA